MTFSVRTAFSDNQITHGEAVSLVVDARNRYAQVHGDASARATSDPDVLKRAVAERLVAEGVDATQAATAADRVVVAWLNSSSMRGARGDDSAVSFQPGQVVFPDRAAPPPRPPAPPPPSGVVAPPTTTRVRSLIADGAISGGDARQIVEQARRDAGLPRASTYGREIVPAVVALLSRAGIDATEANRLARQLVETWSGASTSANAAAARGENFDNAYLAAFRQQTGGTGHIAVPPPSTTGAAKTVPLDRLPAASAEVRSGYAHLRAGEPMTDAEAAAIAQRALARQGVSSDNLDVRTLRSAVSVLLTLEGNLRPDIDVDQCAHRIVSQSRYVSTEGEVAANPGRVRARPLAEIQADPAGFLRQAPQIDGSGSTRQDRTACVVMSLVGGMLLADPRSVTAMASRLASSEGASAFPALQQEPFKTALSRVAAGTFSPADLTTLGRGLYVASVPEGATGTTDGDLLGLVGRLTSLGVDIPSFDIDTFGTASGSGTHSTAFSNGVGYDPWPYPGSNGQARIAVGAAAHQESGEGNARRLGIDQSRMRVNRISISDHGRTLRIENNAVGGVAAPDGGPLMRATYQLSGGSYRRTSLDETGAQGLPTVRARVESLRPYYVPDEVPIDRARRAIVSPQFGEPPPDPPQ